MSFIIIFTLSLIPVQIYSETVQYTSKDLGIENTLLTPLGAQRSGNQDNSIPPWTGGITKCPKNYKQGDHHPFPFPEDQKLFTITSDNFHKYKDKLTDGTIALLKKYPKTFFMQVYPTHRTASMPKWVYEAVMDNAKQARLVENGSGIKNARISCPFPVPGNGMEAIWNHLVSFRGICCKKIVVQAAPTQFGDYTLMRMEEIGWMHYSIRDQSIQEIDNNNIYAYFLQKISSPPRLAGSGLLIHEYLNQFRDQRKAWTYQPGFRRVIRSPLVGYEYPGTASDGLRTVDDWNMFNGAIDKYTWKLLGKKEIFVPYNCYTLHSDKIKYRDILTKYHINQKLVRYERHRVWVVEATLKDFQKHLYLRRLFYLDEDSWFCLAAEMYDRNNKLWRVALSHTINYYDVPVLWSTVDVFHDLPGMRYLAGNLNNEEKMLDFTIKLNKKNFTTQMLRNSGVR
jgi:hypothetical protein